MHNCVGAQGLCFSTCMSLCHRPGLPESISFRDSLSSSIPVGLILASLCVILLGRCSLGFFQMLHYLSSWKTGKSVKSHGILTTINESPVVFREEDMFEDYRTPALMTDSNSSQTEGSKEIDAVDKKELPAALVTLPYQKILSLDSSNLDRDRDESLRTGTGFTSRVKSSKRPNDFDGYLGMTPLRSKRLSLGNTSLCSLSSCSSLESDLRPPSTTCSCTCSSCGTTCDSSGPSFLAEADEDYMESDLDHDSGIELSFERSPARTKSSVTFEDKTEYARKEFRKSVSPLLEHSPHVGEPRDELGLNFLDGRITTAAWMCGRDVVALKLECGLGWLDLVRPCLDDFYGEQWERKVHPEDLERCKATFSEAKANQGPFQVEYRLQVAPDDYRWVMDLAKTRFSLLHHDFLGFVGWRVDIHKQKSVQLDMEKYWSLPHEILTKASTDGKYFENVSPSFTNRLGYTQEEFLRTEWMELLHPDDREYTMSEFKNVSLGQPIVNLQNRYRCKDGAKVEGPTFVDSTGTYKWFNWTANYMYGAGRDISGEKVAQEELRRSQAELRRITDAIPEERNLLLEEISSC